MAALAGLWARSWRHKGGRSPHSCRLVEPPGSCEKPTLWEEGEMPKFSVHPCTRSRMGMKAGAHFSRAQGCDLACTLNAHEGSGWNRSPHGRPAPWVSPRAGSGGGSVRRTKPPPASARARRSPRGLGRRNPRSALLPRPWQNLTRERVLSRMASLLDSGAAPRLRRRHGSQQARSFALARTRSPSWGGSPRGGSG